jgi:hypothetical protein
MREFKSRRTHKEEKKMKISLYLPKGSKGAKAFVDKELSTARHIKSLATRNDVVAGLGKISSCL